ncbi:hypothetical protein BDV38DRAFT_266882 [Aspergillus pseudotamarii]|uniref:Zinc finger PHD-type domain-containing protein n=1 Tax=Aspergillus pseudotamarii TaxID=132259 RepID=A0A5N6TBH6_ASPPS|nr:uncharacterized protein BDV38DRAFT_266882 [Aspergillus pseudotamarii]KAE8143724.1 hypothetical protein BDV38DRAFT_266882 [Aspergillus pseudotamarii]
MGCRGLWNLHIHGKWYRSYHPRALISHPDDKRIWRTVKEVLDKPFDLKGWVLSPCPSPIHSNLDYVYTIDHVAGVFIISLWGEPDGILVPTAIRIDLARFHEDDFSLSINHPLPRPEYLVGDGTSVVHGSHYEPLDSEMLTFDFGIPTPMNELQELLFTDFVFLWRFYIDDPLTWRCSSPVFKLLCIALLRLAAWDLEVSPNSDLGHVELPISFSSVPSWRYPKADIYWFHGYLIVLHEDIGSKAMISGAIMKAKSYIDNLEYECNDVHLILISPFQVAFVELLQGTIMTSKSLALLTNASANQCSPGFRALVRVLTSDRRIKYHAYRETWEYNIPPEMLQRLLYALEPRDAVAFSQASFVAEECYYASIPQIKDIVVQTFKSSIPCCGKRGDLEEQGICCSKCHSWQHLGCVGLGNQPLDSNYVCFDCYKNRTCTTLKPGRINRTSCRRRREGHPVKVGCAEQLLQLRLLKPSHLRPELRLVRNLRPIPPCLIDHTILFNGAFSGLAYGLENTT